MTVPPPRLPRARVVVSRSDRWLWLIPLLALITAAVLLGSYASRLGPRIMLSFPQGHGLKTGDHLRYRGIVVGQVTSLSLSPGGDEILAEVRLQRNTGHLARAGSLFWIVHPVANLQGLEGLETLTGPRYVTMQPGSGPPQRYFEGLAAPPVPEHRVAEGLEIMLEAPERQNLQIGAPVLYRGIRIGSILTVGLASDAATVETRIYVRPAFTGLVRENSRFWQVGGISASGHLVTGIQVQVPPLQNLVAGGVVLATPNQPGKPIATGHRFSLASAADPEWLSWRPPLPLGVDLLPQNVSLPDVRRMTLRRAGGGVLGALGRERATLCWGIVLDEGLLIPADALPPGAEQVRLELSGQSLAIDEALVTRFSELRLIPWDLLPDQAPSAALASHSLAASTFTKPEEMVVWTDRPEALAVIGEARLRQAGALWQVDPAVVLSRDLHGAAVLSRNDGQLLGMLLIQNDRTLIAPLPQAP